MEKPGTSLEGDREETAFVSLTKGVLRESWIDEGTPSQNTERASRSGWKAGNDDG
jgi:hypothetical protein